MSLLKKLQSIKQKMATAAQEVIDEWDQDEEGYDEEIGTGGVCDQVSSAISGVISEAIPEAEFTDGGQDGDDHAFLIVYDDQESYAVDIPPRVYETGGGYSWKKIENAVVTADDIVIEKVDRDLIGDW